jgi:uncharacterized protein YraI
MRRRLLVHALGALLLASFGLASAQNAYTSRPMNVRAGPNRDYPLVAQLDEGAALDVHGCLSDWSWCDVSFDDTRGWIYAGGVSFVYQDQRVPLYSYGPSLGLPIITFSLLGYWDHYYRGRPWYGQRDDWSHRRLPPHLRPPGRSHAGLPPMPPGRPAPGHRPEREGAGPAHAAPGVRPGSGRPEMQERRPPNGGTPMQERRPPNGGTAKPRGEERTHAGPPGRTVAPQKRERGEHPPGHPPPA